MSARCKQILLVHHKKSLQEDLSSIIEEIKKYIYYTLTAHNIVYINHLTFFILLLNSGSFLAYCSKKHNSKYQNSILRYNTKDLKCCT